MSWSDPQTQFFVVINGEEQYSIWPSYQPVPAGWRAIGEAKCKDDCLDYIEAHWTDMRPRKVREHAAQAQRDEKKR